MFFPPGTNEYFSKIAAEFGLDISFADLTKLELLKAALKPNTKVHLAEKALQKLQWANGEMGKYLLTWLNLTIYTY